MPELPFEIPIPTPHQAVFIMVAVATGVASLLVVTNRNLFYSALCLVGALFGVAGVYVLLEAEFLAITQVLVYVGAIATLITFAIMLTRGIMFGVTSPNNRYMFAVMSMALLVFLLVAGVVDRVPWAVAEDLTLSGDGKSMIVDLGWEFVTTYALPLELIGLLLLIALVGAVMLARDDE